MTNTQTLTTNQCSQDQLSKAQTPLMQLPSGPRMSFFYTPADGERLFTWLEIPAESVPVRGIAVLCGSLGHEYMSLHRSMRAIASRLAVEGIASLRFDYRGTGDSSGDAFGEDQIKGFVTDVISVIDMAKSMFGELPVSVIGISLGGTFAALAAAEINVDTLVLWNACVSGRKFVREQQMLSKLLNKSEEAQRDNVIDAAGIVMPASMEADLKSINLKKMDHFQCRHAVVLDRDDLPEDRSLADVISAQGITVKYFQVSGYSDMVTFPTDTKIPDLAIDTLIEALDLPAAPANTIRDAADCLPAVADSYLLGGNDTSYSGPQERPAVFGPDGRLFGVACHTNFADLADRGGDAVVFLNCGSEHHVGPHRLYTELSRRFATQGLLCFRFDIEGIGDSPANGRNEDNFPYSPVALQDIEEALEYLKSEYGCKRFLLTGICAGAYHSFQAAVTLDNYAIAGAVMINPLVFEWEHSQYADTTETEQSNSYSDVAYYRKALFQPKSWLKLLKGGVDLQNLTRVFLRLTKVLATSLSNRLFSLLGQEESSRLAKEMRSCMNAGRKLSLVFAEGDAGHVILKTEAPGTVDKGIGDGMVSIDLLKDADHGFSKSYMRKDLVTAVEKRIAFVFGL